MAAAGGRGSAIKQIISSPQWQIYLYLHSYYLAALFVTELLIFVWKGSVLPYDESIAGVEVTVLILLMVLEFVRILWGLKGNLTERRLATFISISISPISAIGALYFILWQTFVLKLDVILFSIELILMAIETILAIVVFASIKSPPPTMKND